MPRCIFFGYHSINVQTNNKNMSNGYSEDKFSKERLCSQCNLLLHMYYHLVISVKMNITFRLNVSIEYPKY